MKLARVGNKQCHGRMAYASGGRVPEDISDSGSLPSVSGGPKDDGMGVDGGKAKGRLDRAAKKSPTTNVNIIVTSSKPEPAAPPMPPASPMGGPPPPMPPPGVPMRASGGRVNASGQSFKTEKEAEKRSVARKHGDRVIDAGAGGGLGRLEKAKDYGTKPAKGK